MWCVVDWFRVVSFDPYGTKALQLRRELLDVCNMRFIALHSLLLLILASRCRCCCCLLLVLVVVVVVVVDTLVMWSILIFLSRALMNVTPREEEDGSGKYDLVRFNVRGGGGGGGGSVTSLLVSSCSLAVVVIVGNNCRRCSCCCRLLMESRSDS